MSETWTSEKKHCWDDVEAQVERLGRTISTLRAIQSGERPVRVGLGITDEMQGDMTSAEVMEQVSLQSSAERRAVFRQAIALVDRLREFYTAPEQRQPFPQLEADE